MPGRVLVITFFTLVYAFGQAQQIRILDSGHSVSLRGLSVVNDQVIWVSGSSGSVGHSTDGGKTWKWISVPHYENSDFRDIDAVSDQTAIIMGITQPAVILRTTDGGNSWKTVFEDSSKSVFLDAMDFSQNTAIAVGDPIDDRIFIARSADSGKTWRKTEPSGYQLAVKGESFFAASGSNLRLNPVVNNGIQEEAVIVSGGMKSCLYLKSGRYSLRMNQGKETAGANSIAINPWHPGQAFVVGGDFRKDTVTNGNSLLIGLNPFNQNTPVTAPHGYRSCVEYLTDRQMICCGTSGVDFSVDGGLNWKLISTRGFHVCQRSKSGNAVFLAGPKGLIARLVP
jgi:photosystem II stability/assembly factor-like uncharacterized protein